jgi:uncharacterized membrane protein YciS (DUF1049 family)
MTEPNGNGARSVTGLSVPLLLAAGLVMAAFTAGGAWISHTGRVADLEKRVERLERAIEGRPQWKGPF